MYDDYFSKNRCGVLSILTSQHHVCYSRNEWKFIHFSSIATSVIIKREKKPTFASVEYADSVLQNILHYFSPCRKSLRCGIKRNAAVSFFFLIGLGFSSEKKKILRKMKNESREEKVNSSEKLSSNLPGYPLG